MKMSKLLLLLAIIGLTACGGGTSVAPLPPTLSGPAYTGTITNSDGTATRNVQFNFIQNADNTLSGVVTIENRGTSNDCLLGGGPIDSARSSINGFNATVSVTLFSSGSNDDSDDDDSNNASSSAGGVLFSLSVDDNSLSGNYSVFGETLCSGQNRSGTITASR